MAKKMVLLMRKGWIEGLHPRDGDGRFALAPDTGINPHIGNNSETESLKTFKAELKETLESMAVPRMKVAYTQENFKKLFGEWNRVDTPVGKVTVPYSQFNKLKDRDRTGWLGAMYQTITDPILVIQESPKKKLFIKTFVPEREGVITFMSVIIDEDNSKVNISNHEKDMNNILNKIKSGGAVIYKKTTDAGLGGLTIGKALRGAPPAGDETGKPETHLPTVSAEGLKKSIAPWRVA